MALVRGAHEPLSAIPTRRIGVIAPSRALTLAATGMREHVAGVAVEWLDIAHMCGLVSSLESRSLTADLWRQVDAVGLATYIHGMYVSLWPHCDSSGIRARRRQTCASMASRSPRPKRRSSTTLRSLSRIPTVRTTKSGSAPRDERRASRPPGRPLRPRGWVGRPTDLGPESHPL